MPELISQSHAPLSPPPGVAPNPRSSAGALVHPAYDVFALGIVMWEMLYEGVRPYDGLIPLAIPNAVQRGARPVFGAMDAPLAYRSVGSSVGSDHSLVVGRRAAPINCPALPCPTLPRAAALHSVCGAPHPGRLLMRCACAAQPACVLRQARGMPCLRSARRGSASRLHCACCGAC